MKTICIFIVAFLLVSCGDEIPRHIMGDYYLEQRHIDLHIFYLVQDKKNCEDKEAAARIGVSDQFIYWETFHCHEPWEEVDPRHKPLCRQTIYRIDTQAKKETRVDRIPEHVKMHQAEEFYYSLEKTQLSDWLSGWWNNCEE